MSTIESDLVEDDDARRVHAQSRQSPPDTQPTRMNGVVTGTLIGFKDGGETPLVIFPGQLGTAAVVARATLDIHAAHIGREVVLLFEEADPRRPIIVGCMQGADRWSCTGLGGQIEVDVDGERMILSAKEQLVLRCGKASITLTKAGKVIINGTYLSNRSSGVLRLRGGAVQIN